ncbi:asparagine synthase-related protein [Paracoccus contaminans]|uniref:asparagine synthase (glutamine-hydrolyzing) n=1 Tax=Paracoccus contaminans TaxID=1945662 RepID=A0A1W6CVP9_9RHOB|nr:asparagine synthase-related protein [Paracoccus contaminans]ARJ68963.1 hypothetical protein B0A89_04285 [Paracoccus contaminans]
MSHALNRFAAIIGPDADRGIVMRVKGDLARRHGPVLHDEPCGGALLMQAGPGLAARLGPLTLVGDLGLTDLADLRRSLSAAPAAGPGDLVLAAWLRWGEDAARRLCGAFAFAVHDRRTGGLTLVRDRFGVRPLVHASRGGCMIVAQDLSTVLAGLGAQPEVDRAWVADFLCGRPTSTEATAYEGVTRLAPGHLARIGPDARHAVRAWYRLADAAPPDAGADGAQALRAALAHATAEACAAGPAATMLSGGLDSSSLSLLSVEGGGDDAPRPALSLRYRDPAMDEGFFIDAVLERAGGRLAPVSLPGEVGDALFDLDPQLDAQDQPFFAPGMASSAQLYRATRQAGATGVLDGHGGDEVIGGAFADIARLAGEGRWVQALGLARAYARFTGSAPRETLGLLLAWKGRRGFARLGRRLAPEGGGGDPFAWRSLVDRGLAVETGLVERVRAQAEAGEGGDPALPASVRHHAAMLSAPLIAGAFEVLDRAARSAGVVPLYPFYDHRVVELCLWQPDAARIRHGQPRALLREAMRGVLPEAVRLRADKTDFIADFHAALRRDCAGRLARLRAGPAILQGWVDGATLRADLAQLDHDPAPDAQAIFRLWRAIWLAAWLERRASWAAPPAGAAPLPAALAPTAPQGAAFATAAPLCPGPLFD